MTSTGSETDHCERKNDDNEAVLDSCSASLLHVRSTHQGQEIFAHLKLKTQKIQFINIQTIETKWRSICLLLRGIRTPPDWMNQRILDQSPCRHQRQCCKMLDSSFRRRCRRHPHLETRILGRTNTWPRPEEKYVDSNRFSKTDFRCIESLSFFCHRPQKT